MGEEKKVEIKCNKCGVAFLPKGWQRRRENRIHSENIFRIFFDCPKCRVVYVVYYESNLVRALMTANGELRAQIDNKRTREEERKKLLAQIKLNQQKIESEQVRIKEMLG